MFRRYHWLFAFIVLCGFVSIRCEPGDCDSDVEHKVCAEYDDNVSNETFSFRYHFKDDSIATGFGALSIGRNLYRLRSGSFRFNIRGTTHQFKYNIDKSGDEDDESGDVRGSLTFSPSNATAIEEKYETSGMLMNNGFAFSRRHREIRANGNFDWYMKLLFPANENHPVFLCKFSGHRNITKSSFECVTYENRNESMVENTPNKPETEWRSDFIEPIGKVLSADNHHDGIGHYSFKYNFSNGAVISEVGKLNRNNKVIFINGSITFGQDEVGEYSAEDGDIKDLQLTYTGNATSCNVCLSYTDEDGSLKQKQFVLQYRRIGWWVNSPVYSDDRNDFSISADRKLIFEDGLALVNAKIEIRFLHPGGDGLFVVQTFEISEILSDAYLVVVLDDRLTDNILSIEPRALISLVG